LKKWTIVFAFVAACGRERATPPPATETHPPAPPPIAIRSVVATPAAGASYDEAMVWLRSAPRFRFAIDEGGVHAEGTMTRPTIGAETIELRAGGDEWRAEAKPQGVVWHKRKGAAWAAAAGPGYGNHLYQRATVVFDPMKKEGAPRLISSENGTTLFRFTDANSGNVHEVWVSNADNHVEKIKIGGVMEMTIQP
jgi:hypothetical protein